MSLLDLMKFCEAEKIAVTFWLRAGERVTGVPEYVGFDIDTGQLLNVNGKTVAMHDFSVITVSNPDYS
jgi:hypothetical protein